MARAITLLNYCMCVDEIPGSYEMSSQSSEMASSHLCREVNGPNPKVFNVITSSTQNGKQLSLSEFTSSLEIAITYVFFGSAESRACTRSRTTNMCHDTRVTHVTRGVGLVTRRVVARAHSKRAVSKYVRSSKEKGQRESRTIVLASMDSAICAEPKVESQNSPTTWLRR